MHTESVKRKMFDFSIEYTDLSVGISLRYADSFTPSRKKTHLKHNLIRIRQSNIYYDSIAAVDSAHGVILWIQFCFERVVLSQKVQLCLHSVEIIIQSANSIVTPELTGLH